MLRLGFIALFVIGCAGSGESGKEDIAPDGPTSGGGGEDNPNDTCSVATTTCSTTDECCDGLECGTTTLGQVCCGGQGATCKTANGEDCCGDLLCVDGVCGGETQFRAPFPCNQRWTYSHHSAEVRLALDFIRDDGGATNLSPVLASAGGTAYRRFENGGAGQYIVIDHGNGWTTYYFHLSSYSVNDGVAVTKGQEVGKVGTTGASSGPHLHYEQLLNGVGQPIVIEGEALSPYPANYGQKSITSKNACPP